MEKSPLTISRNTSEWEGFRQPSQLLKAPPSFSKCRLYTYVLAITLGSFQYGYSLGVYSPVSKVLMQLFYNSGFPWSPVDKEPYNTIISTVPQVGAFIGAFTAFGFIKTNRLRGIFIFNLISIIGAILSCFLNMPVFLIGRFISGYSAGAFSFLIPLFVNEVSPTKVRGATSMFVQLQITFGILIPALFGINFPDDSRELKQSDFFWRVVVGFPIAVSIFQIFVFMIFYCQNTPPNNLTYHRKTQALQALKFVYQNEGAALRFQQMDLESSLLNRSLADSSNLLSINPRKALYICIILQIFKQLTGISAIYFYSSQLFGSHDDPYNISVGNRVTVLIGATNFVSAAIALPFVDKLGRKPMLVIGFFIMSAAIILVGVFKVQDNHLFASILILVFIIAYEFSAGPVLWIYIPEVLNTAGLSLASSATWIFIIIISLTTPILQKAANEWVFFIFGICNFCGAVFQWIFLIESKGRSRFEMQEKYLGRGTPLVYRQSP